MCRLRHIEIGGAVEKLCWQRLLTSESSEGGPSREEETVNIKSAYFPFAAVNFLFENAESRKLRRIQERVRLSCCQLFLGEVVRIVAKMDMNKAMKECMKPHALMHSLTGFAVAMIVVGLFPDLLGVALVAGVVLLLVGIVGDLWSQKMV